LFSKGNMLLAAASELTYHTVKCSALNAEELNREHGFIVSEIYILCIINTNVINFFRMFNYILIV